jgi:hypothetical protein
MDDIHDYNTRYNMYITYYACMLPKHPTFSFHIITQYINEYNIINVLIFNKHLKNLL